MLTVVLTCDDGSSAIGSGCKTTYYTTDGSDPTTTSLQGNSVVVSAEGITTIKYFSVDNAGNEEIVKTAANTVKIDKINPTVTLDSITSPTGGTTNSIDITGTVSDANIASYQLTVADATNNVIDDTGILTTTGGAITSYPWDISSLVSGTYTVVLTATDAFGQTGVATQDVVIDNTVPVTPVARMVVVNTPSIVLPLRLATPIIPTTTGGEVLGDTAGGDVAPETTGGAETTPEVLGTETTNDNLSNPAAVATTGSGWSIFGLMWYWWLLILAAIASAWWIISAAIRRNRQGA